MALNNESSLSNLSHRLEVLAHRLTHVDRLLSALLLGAERAVATDFPGLLPPRGAPLHHALAARHGGTSSAAAAAGGREDGGRHHGEGRGYAPGDYAQPSPLRGERRGGGHTGAAFSGVAGSGSGSFGHGHAAAPPPPSPLASPTAGRTGRAGVLAEANFGGDLTITIHAVRGLVGMSKSAQLFVKVRRSI